MHSHSFSLLYTRLHQNTYDMFINFDNPSIKNLGMDPKCVVTSKISIQRRTFFPQVKLIYRRRPFDTRASSHLLLTSRFPPASRGTV